MNTDIHRAVTPLVLQIIDITEPHIAASVFKTLRELQKDVPNLVLVREGYWTLVETCRDMEAEIQALRAVAGKYDGKRK